MLRFNMLLYVFRLTFLGYRLSAQERFCPSIELFIFICDALNFSLNLDGVASAPPFLCLFHCLFIFVCCPFCFVLIFHVSSHFLIIHCPIGDTNFCGLEGARPRTTTHDHARPRTTTHDHERPRTTTNDHARPRTTTHDHERPRTTTHDHERPCTCCR